MTIQANNPQTQETTFPFKGTAFGQNKAEAAAAFEALSGKSHGSVVLKMFVVGITFYGMATFEVTTDAVGVVQSVILVGAVVDRVAWLRVARALKERLAERRLRVASPGRGGVIRIRVERGELRRLHEAAGRRLDDAVGIRLRGEPVSEQLWRRPGRSYRRVRRRDLEQHRQLQQLLHGARVR